jgi:hypothetical protein
MPRFDGTGPMGQGPMTGRGTGYCAVQVSPPARATGAVGPSPGAYYPVFAGAPGVAAYGFPRPFYPRFGRGWGIGRGRGFGVRGGRGRGGRGRWW